MKNAQQLNSTQSHSAVKYRKSFDNTQFSRSQNQDQITILNDNNVSTSQSGISFEIKSSDSSQKFLTSIENSRNTKSHNLKNRRSTVFIGKGLTSFSKTKSARSTTPNNTIRQMNMNFKSNGIKKEKNIMRHMKNNSAKTQREFELKYGKNQSNFINRIFTDESDKTERNLPDIETKLLYLIHENQKLSESLFEKSMIINDLNLKVKKLELHHGSHLSTLNQIEIERQRSIENQISQITENHATKLHSLEKENKSLLEKIKSMAKSEENLNQKIQSLQAEIADLQYEREILKNKMNQSEKEKYNLKNSTHTKDQIELWKQKYHDLENSFTQKSIVSKNKLEKSLQSEFDDKIKRLQITQQNEKEALMKRINQLEEKIILLEHEKKELNCKLDEVMMIHADMKTQHQLLIIQNNHLEQWQKENHDKLSTLPKEKHDVIESWKQKYEALEKQNIASIESLKEIFNNSLQEEMRLKDKQYAIKFEREQMINKNVIDKLNELIKNLEKKMDIVIKEKEEVEGTIQDLKKDRDLWKNRFEQCEKLKNEIIQEYKDKLDNKAIQKRERQENIENHELEKKALEQTIALLKTKVLELDKKVAVASIENNILKSKLTIYDH